MPLKHAFFLNKITQLFFRLNNQKVNFSKYTFNCIINDNYCNADDLIRFIKRVHLTIKKCVDIEIKIYDKII